MKKIIQRIAMYQWQVDVYKKFELGQFTEAWKTSATQATPTSDPVEHVRKHLEFCVERLVNTGLLFPIAASEQHLHRAKIGIAGKVYAIRDHRPPVDKVKANERYEETYRAKLIRFTLDSLRELGHAVADCIRHCQAGRLQDTVFLAVHVGRLFERLSVLQFDPDVAAGRPIRKGRPKGTASTKRKFAKRRAELTAKYQPDIDRRVQDGQSFETALMYTANHYNIPRETLRKYVVNPRRRTLPKKV